MINSLLPRNPFVRAALIFLGSLSVYALIARFVFDGSIGPGGGVVVGALLAVLDLRRARGLGTPKSNEERDPGRG